MGRNVLIPSQKSTTPAGTTQLLEVLLIEVVSGTRPRRERGEQFIPVFQNGIQVKKRRNSTTAVMGARMSLIVIVSRRSRLECMWGTRCLTSEYYSAPDTLTLHIVPVEARHGISNVVRFIVAVYS